MATEQVTRTPETIAAEFVRAQRIAEMIHSRLVAADPPLKVTQVISIASTVLITVLTEVATGTVSGESSDEARHRFEGVRHTIGELERFLAECAKSETPEELHRIVLARAQSDTFKYGPAASFNN